MPIPGTIEATPANRALAADDTIGGFDSSGNPRTFTPLEFGAFLDPDFNIARYGAGASETAADNVTAIQAACDAAVAADAVVWGESVTLDINAKIVIKGACDFSRLKLNVTGSPAIAVEVSTGNASDPTTQIANKTIRLPRQITNADRPATGWAAQGVGVRVVNSRSNTIVFGNVIGFATNYLLTAFGANGTAYNNMHLGHAENGQVNLALTPGDTSSWVNENVFIGGRLSHYSGEGTDVAGTRHILISKGTNPVNGNVFIGPSIEGTVAEYHVENGGSYNEIIGARWEASPPRILYNSDATTQGVWNMVIGGYNAQSIAVSKTGSGTARGNQIVSAGRYVANVPSNGMAWRNESSNSAAVLNVFDASTDPYEADPSADFVWRLGAQFLDGKIKADAGPRIRLQPTSGRLYVCNGTLATPTAYIGPSGSSAFAVASHWNPAANNVYDFGNGGLRWRTAFVREVDLNGVKYFSGSGSPESVTDAPVGSIYTRTDGGAGTTLYVKESGTGNTGWAAK